MGKTITTKYDLGDKVWWRHNGKCVNGEIISVSANIYTNSTSIEYTVKVSPEFLYNCGENYKVIRENAIYKSEPKTEQESEKE